MTRFIPGFGYFLTMWLANVVLAWVAFSVGDWPHGLLTVVMAVICLAKAMHSYATETG